MKLFIILILFIPTMLMSQVNNWHTFSSMGSCVTTSSGIQVSQSFGQQSIIGFSSNQNISVASGFQQPFLNVASEAREQETITVYPNPTVDIMKIQFSETTSGEVTLDVVDILGRVVKSSRPSVVGKEVQIDIRDLSSASYILRVTTNQTIINETIIKN